jgi:hypothetical protein
MNEWISVKNKMPESGVPVIAFVVDAHAGKYTRTIRASYAAAKTLEQSPDCDGGEYDADADVYWCDEGWYEDNFFEETHWAVDGTVTHWMPLPDPPKGSVVKAAVVRSRNMSIYDWKRNG